MERPEAQIRISTLCRILVVCLLGCCASKTNAQLRLDGKLADKAGIPIVSATVTLYNRNSGLVLGYDITSTTGAFVLAIDKKPYGELWLYCNATGFYPDSLKITDQFTGLHFRLERLHIMLPEVTVKKRRSFLNIKPDTSNYKTEDFIQKQDRTIEDVLRKIPGIEIDGTGKISHNGKVISNFYVDGDDIVSDRYTIATRTIRPEMVDKIQVIQNHNPVRVLQSSTLSDNIALNLSLKPEARLVLMGEATAGAGTHDTYKLSADLLSFKKQFKFINQFKANNTGTDLSADITPHNMEDLLKRIEQPVSRPFLSTGGLGNPEVGQPRYLFNRVGLLTLNNSFAAKTETQIKFNIHYLYDKQNLTSFSRSVYTLPATSFVYDEKKQLESRMRNLNAQFTVTTNKRRYYLNNLFSVNAAHPGALANGKLNGVGFMQEYNSNNWNISNDLRIISKGTGRNIKEFNSFIRYQNAPETLALLPGLHDSVFNTGIPYQQLMQHVNLKGWFTHHNFSYRVVHDFWVQQYKVGVVAQWQQLGSGLFVTDNAGTIKPSADSFKNNFGWNQYKVYLQSDYDFVIDRTRLSLSFPLSLHTIQKRPEAGIVPANFTKFIFFPSLRYRYDLSAESYINLVYSYNAAPTGVQENYTGYILTNYMVLQAWKLPVVTNSTHFASMGWTGRRSAKLLTAFVNIGFTAGTNHSLPEYTYLNTLQIQDYAQGATNITSQFLNTGLSKYIFALHATIAGKYVLQQNAYEQVQQNQPTRFSDVQQTLSVRVQPKITEWLTASYNLQYTIGTSRNKTQVKLPAQKSSLFMQQLEINVFPVSDLSIHIDGDQYNTSKTYTNLSNAVFMDARIMYHLKKYKTEISIEGTNLTGNNDYTAVSVNGNSSRQVNFPLRPSTLILNVLLRF